MQVVLVTFKSDGERRSFSLPRDVTLIGRREDCDLRIPLGEVSRKHCRLIKDTDSLRVEDLGSSNGTYHNGVRVQESALQGGDVVQVGPVAFVVQIDGVPGDDEIQPPALQPTSQDTSVPASTGDGQPAEGDIVDFDAAEVLEPSEEEPPTLEPIDEPHQPGQHT